MKLVPTSPPLDTTRRFPRTVRSAFHEYSESAIGITGPVIKPGWKFHGAMKPNPLPTIKPDRKPWIARVAAWIFNTK